MKKNIVLSIPADESEDIGDELSDWRNVIFLPFHPNWEILVMVSILVNAILSIFDDVYCTSTYILVFLSYYLCEMVYLTDTILFIMHRKLKEIRRKRVYRKVALKYLALNVLTLIPIYEIKPFLHLSLWKYGSGNSKDIIKVKCLIRLYRIFIYLDRKSDEAGVNELVTLTTSHVIRLIIIGHLSGAAIYYLRIYKPNWTRNMSMYIFDQASPENWVALCFTLMTSVAIHNWPGAIKPETNLEKLVFIFTMLLGYTLHMMLFVGYLMSMFKKTYRDYFEYETRVAKIVQLLDDWEVDDELREKTLNYYNVFWQRRFGIKDMPQMFQNLPISLRKEVTVDLFWEALRHSHFFVGTDISFKRSVSLVMKCHFLLPGEFLFRTGEPKAKLVYIVSGVLQILSNEDDDSPIMSFSRGTLLGETACLLAANSIANLRSATYCEIQTLALTDLHHVLMTYPAVAKYIRKQLVHRIYVARVYNDERNSQMALIRENYNVTNDPPIKRLKERWRRIFKIHNEQLEFDKDLFADSTSSANFDLLVLSADVELRVESICLSGKCPYVMDPDNGFRIFCDFIVLLAVITQGLIIPKAVFFERVLSDSVKSVCFLMDFIYVLDIYLQISTAVKIKNRLIINFRRIVVLRIRQTSFLVDLIATIPLDYIILIGLGDTQSVALCKLFRLLKMYKLLFMLKYLERKMVLNTMCIKILKYVLIYIFSIYWLACLLYGLSCPRAGCSENSWFLYNSRIYGHTRNDTWYRFSESLYLTITLFINYGDNSYGAYIILDLILFHLITFIGHLIYSYGFAELISTIVLKYHTKKLNSRHLCALKREATEYNIDSSVRTNVLNFLNFHYSVTSGYQILGQKSVFASAPLELRNEIIRHRIINCLKKVPLFADSSDDLLRYICAHSELKLVPEDSILLRSENKSDILYVIMKGYCRMHSTLPGDLERNSTAILQAGDTFPFLESFHDAFSFMTVYALTAVEILLLPTRIVLNAFQTDETDDGCLKAALAYHKKVYGSILFRKGARLPMLRCVEKSKRKGQMFSYDVYDVDYVQFSEEAFREPFMKMGGWSFIRFFLIRRTINPNGGFYLVWEVSRCCLALSQVIMLILYPNILMGAHLTEKQLLTITTFFSAACVIDIYVRLHCQYYNPKGILVTHPLRTAQHYVASSFITDGIGLLPIQALGIHRLFGPNYEMLNYIVLMFTTRYLQLHRLFNGLSYLEDRSSGIITTIINRFKYAVFALVFIGGMSAIFQLLTCDIQGRQLRCNNTWLIQQIHGNEELNTYDRIYLLVAYYKVTSFFTLSTSGNPSYFSDISVAILVITPVYIARWFVLLKITSKGIGGNVELTLYRDRMNNYFTFLKGAFVSTEVIDAIVSHYEYMWKKSRGMSMYHVLKHFHPQLEQDMAYSLYSNCLEAAYLFRGEHNSLYQALSPMFHREYYTKDSKIIQCNDVQGKIFFVQEGNVEISIANTKVCVLENGGMFGCLSKSGMTRQTLTATAVVHSTVLTIESRVFHKTLASFPKVLERIKRVNSLNYEYLQEHGLSSQIQQVTVQQESGLYQKYKEFYDKILISQSSGWYPKFDYFTNVHVAALTTLFVLAVTFAHMNNQSHVNIVYYVVYTTDVLQLIKILFNFHVMYIDPVSGKVVKDPYAIRRRYVRTIFWYHLFTMVPFELIIGGYTANKMIPKFCMLNRCFRFISLYIYYHQSEARLAMKKHLKWTFMIYKNLLSVQIMVCAWILTACPGSDCSYNDSTTKTKAEIHTSKSKIDSMIIAYLHVLLATVLISLVTLFLTANLCSGFASLITVERHNFGLYELKLKRLWMYLQEREVSPFLCTKIWDYCLINWQWQHGSWLPALIKEAPDFLKQRIMGSLYGKHLYNHYLFEHTHVDFLRQVLGHFERYVFLPDYSIVEKGDSDRCMYFVHKGQVDVFDVKGKTETKIKCLKDGMSFGEAQGLLCISHEYSYRANTVADILILKKYRWKYLLNWFPASKEEIINKAVEYGLFTKEDSYTL